MIKTKKIFMAFASGRETTTTNVVKRFVGVAPVTVLAVNPTKEVLSEIYGTEIENEPMYVGQTQDGVERAQIDIIIKTAETCNVDTVAKLTFFLNNAPMYNRDKTKVKVINKYGECAWIPIENARVGTVPENLSWFEAAEYRPAYVGEEQLTKFIRTYLNIPNKSFKKKDGTIGYIPNKADAEARLDEIAKYFKGDFKEIISTIGLQPMNEIKVLFGVRTTDEGKQYQTVFNEEFLKPSSDDFLKLEKAVTDRKAAGAYPTTEFVVCPLKEYEVEATDFKSVEAPAAAAPTANPWGL